MQYRYTTIRQVIDTRYDNHTLPLEMLLKIFGMLDAASVANAGAACRFWHDAATDNALWFGLVKR